MKTQLFIEDYEIELNDSVQFLLNKQFEEVSNPTIIINDWSKTVSIPFTKKNNKTFGYIYKPERVIISDGTDDSYKRMQVYFDPTKKLDFKLVYNSITLMTGYAKMNEIKQTNGTGTYEITLFGELGKVFQEMKKITFDTTVDDSTYLINGEDYVSETIDRNLVYNSWVSIGQTHVNLMKKTNPYYNINDILGWAPNNSFNDGFDYKTFLNALSTSKLFKDVLENKNFATITGISAETALDTGMTPRGIGEYRSYLQLPYIYWNKLFQIFQEKAEQITGYTFDLDGTFFTSSNPDWYNLVYMLKAFNATGQTNEPNYKNSYNLWIPDSGYIYWGSAGYTSTKSTILGATIINENYPVLETGGLSQTTGYDFKLDDFSGRFVGDLPCSFRFLTYSEYYKNSQLNPDNGFVFTVNILDDNSNILSTADYLLCRSNTTVDKSLYNNVIENDNVTLGYNDSQLMDRFDFSIPINTFIPRGYTISVLIKGKFLTTNVPFVKVGGGGQLLLPLINLYLRSNNETLTLNNEIRSNSHFTLNDLWNKDFNLFNEVLKYCKMYRIFIFTDDFNKKIHFVQYDKYFENYVIEDWTEKLDKSKDYIIKPITFDTKYVLFNYDDDKSRLNETYKEKYSLNIGEYRLNTNYEFNTSETKLFEGVKGGITNTDYVLSWTNLYDNIRIVYSFPSEIYVYCKDKDSKFNDVFGRFYFFNGLALFSTEAALNMRDVKISDDTRLQLGANTFFYSQGYNGANVTTFPHLDVVYGNNLCLFAEPKENYTYDNNYSNKNSIYLKYWKTYLDERYNILNKMVTCYLKITPADFLNFEFNKFIKIDSVLYIVNKIYDFNIETNETTKVDLITITDINGYIN